MDNPQKSRLSVNTLPQRNLLFGGLFLHGHGLPSRTLSRAGIRSGSLSSRRKALTMAQTAIGAEVHQTLDAQRGFTSDLSFDSTSPVDNLANASYLLFGQRVSPGIYVNLGLSQDFACRGSADTDDIRQRNFDSLISW